MTDNNQGSAPDIGIETTLLGSLLSIWIGIVVFRINSIDSTDIRFNLDKGIYYLYLIIFITVLITLLRVAISKKLFRDRFHEYISVLISNAGGVIGLRSALPETSENGLVFFGFIIILLWIMSIEYSTLRIRKKVSGDY